MGSLKLGTKFSILLTFVFLVGAVIGGFALWQVLQNKAEAEVAARGAVLLETMNAVRSYTIDHVDPLLQMGATAQQEFVPEMVPAFAAREIFEHLREDQKFEDFFYKEAASNPTNLRDQADSFEADLLKLMQQDTQAEYSAFRTREDEQVYYIARPMRVTSEQCLVCHGVPEDAPAGQLAEYGSENGFGWRVNDVIAAQIVYVPAEEVLRAASRSFAIAAGAMIATLALILIVVNILLHRDIIQPVAVLGGLARKLSTDELVSTDLQSEQLSRVVGRSDELGHAARVFQQMASEVYARTQSLKQQVRELRIEIDEVKRSQQVTDVVETEFFQDLQASARKMRTQRQRGTASTPDDDSSDVA
ncbi:MAG TPA: DUF3365 domain-containing protein [Anaerolineae bacterium]|nr:DUF3365 domain-containing protein [Anaerolineae bacterium]